MSSFIKSLIIFAYIWVYALFPTVHAGYTFHVGFTNNAFDHLEDFASVPRSLNKVAFNEDSTLYLTIYHHLDKDHKPKLLKRHILSKNQPALKDKVDLQEGEEFLETSPLKSQLIYQLNSQGNIALDMPSDFNEPITLLTPFSGYIYYAGVAMQEIGPSQGIPSYLNFTAHAKQIASLHFLKGDNELALLEALNLQKLDIATSIPLLIKEEVITKHIRLKTPSLQNHGIITWKKAHFDMAELVNKTGGVLEGKKTTFSNLRERSEEGESSNATVPPETSSKILHLKNLTNEGEIYLNKVNYLSLENLGNKGIIHAKAPLKLTTEDFNNKGGSLGSAVHTFLKVTKSFSNSKGTIGRAGITQFNWQGSQAPLFFSIEESLSKGMILGDKTFIGMESQFALPLQGDVVGKSRVLFNNASSAAYPDLVFHTPLLELTGDFPALKPQTQCDLISYKLPANGAISLNEFSTSGRLELWQSGYDSKDQVRQELEAREEKLEEENGDKPLISLKFPLKVDKGVGIYAPDFKVHLKPQAGSLSQDPLIFLPNNALEAFVRSFDLEEGAVVAQDAEVIAPGGIRIGRLVEDTTRDVFSAFYNNDCPFLSFWDVNNASGMTNAFKHFILKECNRTSLYKLRGEDYSFPKWGRMSNYLPPLPIFVTNNASFLIKTEGYFKGPWQHQGFLEAHTFTIDNNADAFVTASKAHIKQDFVKAGKGNLTLNREIGCLINTFYSKPLECSLNNVVSSDPADFKVGNEISFLGTGKIINEGSSFHVFKTTDSPNLIHRILPTYPCNPPSLMPLEAKGCLHNIHPGSSHKGWFCNATNSMLTSPLLQLTPAWKDGYYPFHPVFSSGSAVQFNADNNPSLQGSFTAPALLIAVGDKSLNLGSLVLTRQPPKPARVSLSDGAYNSYTVYMNAHLDALLKNRAETNPVSFFFKLQDRYWHDHNAAQAFYEPIKDHLMVFEEGKGFGKAGPGALFTLSPTLLIKKVTEQCMKTLNRAFFEILDNPEDNKIDEAGVQQLHVNMSEYLKANAYYSDSGSALAPLRTPQLTPPTKPVLYYLHTLTPEGETELAPQLIFPQAMVDEANGLSGVKINTNFLSILPKNIDSKKLLQMLSMSPPALQVGLSKMIMAQPEAVTNFLMNQSLSRIEGASEETALAFQESEASLETLPTEATGSVNLRGEIGAKHSFILSPGDLSFTGLFTGDDAYIMALDNLLMLSQKERRSHATGYQDRIVYETQAKLKNILLILAGQNLGLQAVVTESGEHTALLALQNLLNETIELDYSSRRDWQDGNKRGTTTAFSRTHVGNKHDSKKITTASGANTVFKLTKIEASESIDSIAGHDIQAQAVYNLSSGSTSYSEKKEGWFNSRTIHHSSSYSFSTAQGNTFSAPQKTSINRGKVLHEASQLQGPHTLIKTQKVYLNAAPNVRDSYSHTKQSDFLRTKVSVDRLHATSYTPTQVEGELTIRAPQVFIDQIDDNPLAWMEHLQVEKGEININVLRTIYNHESFSHTTLSPGFCALLCAAVSLTAICVDGGASFAAFLKLSSTSAAATGATATATAAVATATTEATTVATTTFAAQAVAAAVNAGIISLGSKFVCDMATHGRPGQFFEEMTASKGFRPFATSILTAVGTAGLAHGLNLPDATSGFGARLSHNLGSAAVKTGVDSTLGQQDFADSLQTNLAMAGIDTVAAYCAQQIGDFYGEHLEAAQKEAFDKAVAEGKKPTFSDIDLPIGYEFFCHKAIHGVVGGAFGGLHSLIKNEDFEKGMVSGAVAAVVAETVTELVSRGYMQRAVDRASSLAKEEDREFTAKDLQQALKKEIKAAETWGKASSLAVAFVNGHDVEIAKHMAHNAVDNNFIPLLMGMIVVASAVSTTYDVYDAYKKKGIAGTVEVLIKQGVIHVATLGVAKAAKLGFKAGKQVFKFAGIEFYTAAEVWEAALKSSPLLRALINKVKSADAFLSKKARQFSEKAEQKLFGKSKEPKFKGKGKEKETVTEKTTSTSSRVKEGESNLDSRVRLINNRIPINSEYAGKLYPLEKLPLEIRNKYPHSVPFTGTGHPNFSRYAMKKVQINMSGVRDVDERLVNKIVGYKKTPDGYTWHHHHDGQTMMLVPEDIHNVVKHTGGVAIIKHTRKNH